MKKIVFVNPPLTMEERYSKLDGAGALQPPLGLLYLASTVRAHGYEVDVIDAMALELSIGGTVEQVLEAKPDFFGITTTYLSHRYAVAIAKALRQAAPEIYRILGGPHITAIPEELMKRGPYFDCAVLGEGEDTVVELLDTVTEERSIDHVPGLIFMRDGEPVRTAPRAVIEDLDRLPPPAYELVQDFNLYDLQAIFLAGFPTAPSLLQGDAH